MTGATGGFRASGREDLVGRRSLRLPSRFHISVSFSGLKGSEGHGDPCCEASVVPNYLLVDPQALSLGFSLESIQQKRRDAFPVNALVLQLAQALLKYPVMELRI
jgi:hypothetical protein